MSSEKPCWLDSLCSQIDVLKNPSLPQVFTPQNTVDMQNGLATRPRLETRNRYPVSIACQPAVLRDIGTDFISQPWPSLQLPHKSVSDLDSVTPLVQHGHGEFSSCAQPWPSLEPHSQRALTLSSDESHEGTANSPKNSIKYNPFWHTSNTKNPTDHIQRGAESFINHKAFLESEKSCAFTGDSDMLDFSFRTFKTQDNAVLRHSGQKQRTNSSNSNSLKAHVLGSSPALSQNDFDEFKVPVNSSKRVRHNHLVRKGQTQKLENAPTAASYENNTVESKTKKHDSHFDSSAVAILPQRSGYITTTTSKCNQGSCAEAKKVNYPSLTHLNQNLFASCVSAEETGKCQFKKSISAASTPCLPTDLNPFTPAVINFQGACSKGTKLRSVEEIPPYRGMFPFPFFNAVQSMAFDQLLYTDTSMVVSAPTGSGKTVLFELALVRLLLQVQVSLSDIKVVYIGPMKSLCGERVEDWRNKLSPFGLQCLELTGDTDLNDFNSLNHVQLICTTPEKWDSMTRRWKDNHKMFQNISLMCIDELLDPKSLYKSRMPIHEIHHLLQVHIVGDSQRGATVEAVITRMKMVQSVAPDTPSHPLRFIAASATLPNTEDIAKWLSSHTRPAFVLKLGEEYRPVQLRRVVLGYPFPEGSSEFRFDLNLTYKLQSVIDNYSQGKPTLVFCSSRKSCTQTAETLVKARWGRLSFTPSDVLQELRAASSKIQERKLSELMLHGVGVHHAGLEVQDRKLVEQLFRSGRLPVLISTSTLSVGVNLPAHLVVIKATHMYVMGMAREYSDQQVLQMIGRAGRPQFDTSATVVIMTKVNLRAKYECLVNGKQVIESMLHKNLVEHVNVEVVLNTITNMVDVASWLSHTLLHVRATQNPKHYGLPAGLNTQQVEYKLQELCMEAISRLHGLQLVSIDPETALTSSTERGRLMARYCLEFLTMKQFSSLPVKAGMDQLLKVISGCPEFSDIQLRTSEKKILNALNKDKHQETIRYPLKEKIKSKQMKVYCLIQAGLGCLPLQDYSLSQDLLKIFRVGQRIAKCLMELQWLGADYTTLYHAVQLCKAFKARLWPDSKHLARQLEGIGPTISQSLVLAMITSFQYLEAADPRHLELIANRHPPFGNKIQEAVTHLPRYQLVIQQVKRHTTTIARLVITISITNVDNIKVQSTCGPEHQLVIIVGDEDNTIVFKWKLMDRMLLAGAWQRSVHVKRASAGTNLCFALISLEWAGLDIHTEYRPIYAPGADICNPVPALPCIGPTGQGMKNRAKVNKSKQPPESKTPKPKASNAKGCVQRQIDIMHNKFQHFQYSVQATEKLTHPTNRGTASVSSQGQGVTMNQLEHIRSTTALGMQCSNGTALAAQRCAPNKNTAVSGADNDVVGHRVKTDHWQTPGTEWDNGPDTWADFVTDFWLEEEQEEPSTKTGKMINNGSYIHQRGKKNETTSINCRSENKNSYFPGTSLAYSGISQSKDVCLSVNKTVAASKTVSTDTFKNSPTIQTNFMADKMIINDQQTFDAGHKGCKQNSLKFSPGAKRAGSDESWGQDCKISKTGSFNDTYNTKRNGKTIFSKAVTMTNNLEKRTCKKSNPSFTSKNAPMSAQHDKSICNDATVEKTFIKAGNYQKMTQNQDYDVVERFCEAKNQNCMPDISQGVNVDPTLRMPGETCGHPARDALHGEQESVHKLNAVNTDSERRKGWELVEQAATGNASSRMSQQLDNTSRQEPVEQAATGYVSSRMSQQLDNTSRPGWEHLDLFHSSRNVWCDQGEKDDCVKEVKELPVVHLTDCHQFPYMPGQPPIAQPSRHKCTPFNFSSQADRDHNLLFGNEQATSSVRNLLKDIF